MDTKIAAGNEETLHRAAIDIAFELARRRLGEKGGAMCYAAAGFYMMLDQRGCDSLSANYALANWAAGMASEASLAEVGENSPSLAESSAKLNSVVDDPPIDHSVLRTILDTIGKNDLDEPACRTHVKLSTHQEALVSSELILLKTSAVLLVLSEATGLPGKQEYVHQVRVTVSGWLKTEGQDVSELIDHRLRQYNEALKKGVNKEGMGQMLLVGQVFAEECDLEESQNGVLIALGSMVFPQTYHTVESALEGEDDMQALSPRNEELGEQIRSQCDDLQGQLRQKDDSTAKLLSFVLPDEVEISECVRVANEAAVSLWEILSMRFFCIDLALNEVFGDFANFQSLREFHIGMWSRLFGDVSEINRERYGQYLDAIDRKPGDVSYAEAIGECLSEVAHRPSAVASEAAGGIAHATLTLYVREFRKAAS